VDILDPVEVDSKMWEVSVEVEGKVWEVGEKSCVLSGGSSGVEKNI
jgi:hypothetical protein